MIWSCECCCFRWTEDRILLREEEEQTQVLLPSEPSGAFGSGWWDSFLRAEPGVRSCGWRWWGWSSGWLGRGRLSRACWKLTPEEVWCRWKHRQREYLGEGATEQLGGTKAGDMFVRIWVYSVLHKYSPPRTFNILYCNNIKVVIV